MDTNTYRDIPFTQLLISAIPESFISAAILYFFFRFAPDETKLRLGSGWLYTKDYEERLKNGESKRKYALGLKLTFLTIGEALLLCLVAILFSNIQAAISMGVRFTLLIVARLWRENLQLALAKAVDAKDHYTSGHSERVAKYAKEIARRMGKSQKEQDDIFTMGLLHDIGKIGVSEAIINKNGKLTDEEFAEIKTHPGKGYEILQNVTELPALATGARWHHERYDGRGYPDKLAGATIPEEARIIAVADAYDAMTSKRAYSDVRAQDVVRAEIERCKGSQFDPAIADIMLSMIDDDKEYTMHE